MQVVINGENKVLDSTMSINQLLETLGIEEKVVAVSVNMDIIKRDKWGDFILKENDTLELLQFMSGG